MDIIMSGRTHDIYRGSDGEFMASQNHVGGSLPRDLRPGAFQCYTSHTASDPVRTSQFEQIAAAAASISRQRVRLLGILLAAASPTLCGGPPVLRPIWATEALHRAHSMIRLVARLERKAPRRHKFSEPLGLENKLGVELASIFDSLAIARNEELRACSCPVRDVARNLIELFGPGVGHITLATSVERLALPAFQHRALVLMASELIINSLLHAFEHRSTGRMTLRLDRVNCGMARLAVTDDGCGLFGSAAHQPARCGVINDLADLLQSEVTYRSAPGGGTEAEIDIPLQE
jgi:signal transduction histidine kinase